MTCRNLNDVFNPIPTFVPCLVLKINIDLRKLNFSLEYVLIGIDSFSILLL